MRPPGPEGAPLPAAVEAEGVCRRYGRRWALVDVSLTVSRGRVLLVAGRNGSGKSTLLRVVATALRPDHGRVRVLGHDTQDHPEAVRRSLALLGHATYLYEPLTAKENLEVAARLLGSGADLGPLLEEVGLADRADDPVHTFSAGMRRRLALARTLLQEPEVVLLDEPHAQLDPPGFAMVDRLVERFRSRGATVVMATHLLERSGALGDEAVVLDQGRVAWSGPAAELASGPHGLRGALPG